MDVRLAEADNLLHGKYTPKRSTLMKGANEKKQLTPREQFELFCESVIELQDTSFIKKGVHVSIDIGSSADGGLLFEPRDWPDEEDLRSFLLSFRPFISEKEPIFLTRIYNICYRQIKDIKIKSLIAKDRRYWNLANRAPSFAFKYKGKTASPEEIVHLWINGKYFHKDEDKRRVLKALDKRTERFFKLTFIHFIIDGVALILRLDNLIRYAIENEILSE